MSTKLRNKLIINVSKKLDEQNQNLGIHKAKTLCSPSNKMKKDDDAANFDSASKLNPPSFREMNYIRSSEEIKLLAPTLNE